MTHLIYDFLNLYDACLDNDDAKQQRGALFVNTSGRCPKLSCGDASHYALDDVCSPLGDRHNDSTRVTRDLVWENGGIDDAKVRYPVDPKLEIDNAIFRVHSHLRRGRLWECM